MRHSERMRNAAALLWLLNVLVGWLVAVPVIVVALNAVLCRAGLIA